MAAAAARVDGSQVFDAGEWAGLVAKSRWRGLWLVAHAWGVVALAMLAGARWPWLVPLLIPVVAARQLGLLILMHDAAHGLLHPDRRINDWVGRWLCASALHDYRKIHLQHHRHTQQADDPDLPLSKPFPIARRSLWRKALRDVTGVTFLKLRLGIDLDAWWRHRGRRTADGGRGSSLLSPATGLDRRFVWGSLAFLGAFAAAGYAWLWFALWLAPAALWFPLIYRLRNIAEHALVRVGEPDPFRHARTTLASAWERALLAPYWVNFHGEHHLFTQVPCWNLPRAHALLARRGLLGRMTVARGYADVLRQVVSVGPARPSAATG